jgi:AAA domain
MALVIQSGITNRANKSIVYGVEKIGKTTLVSKAAPKPLFFDLEKRTGLINLDRVEINSANELLYSIGELAKSPAGYKTGVIDSIDAAERYVAEKVCKDNNWKNLKQPGFGDGFVVFRDEWGKFLFSLDALSRAGLNVVLIGHCRITNFTAPDATETYNRYELQLDKENNIVTKSWVDDIIFCNYRTTVTEGSDKKAHGVGGSERLIYTERCAAWDAGNSHNLPTKMKFAPESLAPLFVVTSPKVETVTQQQTGQALPTTVDRAASAVTVSVKDAEAPKNETSDKAAAEIAAQSTSEDVSQSVCDFLEKTSSVDEKALRMFLVNRKQLAPDAPLTTIPEAYAKRALGNVDNFMQCVDKFAKGELK